MKQHEKSRTETPAGSPDAPPPASAELAANRESAERLLRRSDEAIARVLSGNSQAFVEANQQSSGQ